MECPLCRGSSRRSFEKHAISIRDCEVCEHRFAEIEAGDGHVESVYGDDYFEGGGAGYPDYLSEAGVVRRHGQRTARLLGRYMEPGSVLDVGAAAGFFLQGMADRGWRGRGIEPNESMARHGRGKLGLEIEVTSIERFQDGGRRYDLITFIQVLPHLADPRVAFQHALNATEKGGYWLIETWNRESKTARLFGESWHEYSPPSVLHWFSPESVRKLAAEFGMLRVAAGRPSKWIGAGHAKSLVQHKARDSRVWRLASGLLQVVPDGFSLPYPAEDLFWVLLRRSPR